MVEQNDVDVLTLIPLCFADFGMSQFFSPNKILHKAGNSFDHFINRAYFRE
jgi:hypothetical protein